MKKIQYFTSIIALLLALRCSLAQAQKDTTVNAIVFTKVDKPAAFPGGLDGWRRYLEGNLQYPKKALKKNIQGQVRVAMTVDSSGNVLNVKAQNDPGGGLATEAERVIKDGPKWIPAEHNNYKVAYRFAQNITFQLQ